MELAAIFLYKLFSPSPEWCRGHGEAIRKTFGPYPASVATRACGNVKKILSYLPITEVKKEERDEEAPESAVQAKEFGTKISFTFQPNLLSSSQAPASIDVDGHDSLSEEEGDRNGRISTTLLAGLTMSMPSQDTTHSVATTKDRNSPICREGGEWAERYGGKWLQEQCKACQVSGFTWQLLYQKLFDLLTTASDEILENDVSE